MKTIFVTVGTAKQSFHRLFEWVELFYNQYAVPSELKIICQVGHTQVNFLPFEIYDFTDRTSFLNYLEKSDVIISHAGEGTIADCLNLQKKAILVPRLQEYGEHINNHQLQMVQRMSEQQKVCNGITKDFLFEAITYQLIHGNSFNYEKGNSPIFNIIENAIEKYLK